MKMMMMVAERKVPELLGGARKKRGSKLLRKVKTGSFGGNRWLRTSPGKGGEGANILTSLLRRKAKNFQTFPRRAIVAGAFTSRRCARSLQRRVLKFPAQPLPPPRSNFTKMSGTGSGKSTRDNITAKAKPLLWIISQSFPGSQTFRPHYRESSQWLFTKVGGGKVLRKE